MRRPREYYIGATIDPASNSAIYHVRESRDCLPPTIHLFFGRWQTTKRAIRGNRRAILAMLNQYYPLVRLTLDMTG